MDYGHLGMGDYHIFQKPAALMEFLIKQHTNPNELVCTPFGCSGAGIIAAVRLGRNWVYIESNRNNYAWGAQGIQTELSKLSVQAG